MQYTKCILRTSSGKCGCEYTVIAMLPKDLYVLSCPRRGLPCPEGAIPVSHMPLTSMPRRGYTSSPYVLNFHAPKWLYHLSPLTSLSRRGLYGHPICLPCPEGAIPISHMQWRKWATNPAGPCCNGESEQKADCHGFIRFSGPGLRRWCVGCNKNILH